MNTSLTTNITAKEVTELQDSGIWLNMEQEYVPEANNSASEADVMQMLSRAMNGDSALGYITENCPYVQVTATSVVVTLSFYVYPSSLDLPYTLTADIGIIDAGAASELYVSLDAIIDGSDNSQLDFLFEGKESRSMPFILVNGVVDNDVKAEIRGNKLVTTKPGYCVYRLNGRAIGYKHTVTMTIPKTGAETITSFSNNIVAEWGDEQTTTLRLDIPECVTDALKQCDDDSLAYENTQCGGKGKCNEGNPKLQVYFNGCDGETILDERWVDNT